MFSVIDFCAGSPFVSQLLVKLWAYFDDSVLVSFPVAMIKYPVSCDLKEAVFIFLTIPNYTPSLQVSQLVISHLQLRAERRKLMHASWVQLPSPLPHHRSEFPTYEMIPPTVDWVSPISINEIKIISQRHTLQVNLTSHWELLSRLLWTVRNYKLYTPFPSEYCIFLWISQAHYV